MSLFLTILELQTQKRYSKDNSSGLHVIPMNLECRPPTPTQDGLFSHMSSMELGWLGKWLGSGPRSRAYFHSVLWVLRCPLCSLGPLAPHVASPHGLSSRTTGILTQLIKMLNRTESDRSWQDCTFISYSSHKPSLD